LNLKIAILGTRGIPNNYGGYEQAAACLAPLLVKKGHDVSVYNSHHHPYRENNWQGVKIVHCHDPEKKIGTAGQFIYDFNCLRHAAKKNYDILLMMGYTSSSVWGRLYPKKTVIISNMDGLEWKRSKYAAPVQRFLRYAEKLAIKYSDFFIADSTAIADYLSKKYNVAPAYIPYGATIYPPADENLLAKFRLRKKDYFLHIARLEPENNSSMILEGFCKSNSTSKLVVVGNTTTSYGRSLKRIYGSNEQIYFAGPQFDLPVLTALRQYCKFYFHGHSVGGTNPSLLEAMAAGACIAAHDNAFNRAVTGKDAFYFSSADDVSQIIREEIASNAMIANNLKKIEEVYNWERIAEAYESYLLSCYQMKKR
jgi:glycosyltransferase involved in cell wall biosynthesis